MYFNLIMFAYVYIILFGLMFEILLLLKCSSMKNIWHGSPIKTINQAKH